jgi:MFS family permease
MTKKSAYHSLPLGYDDGVIGGLLTSPNFESTFNLNSTLQGTVTSLFVVGALFGCLTSSFLNGAYGRKAIAHVGALVLCVGSVLQCSSYVLAQLLVGRIVAGVGLGLIVSNIIMWQSELSPTHIRGRLVASALSFLILGQLIAYWLEYGISGSQGSFAWRFP